MCCPRFCPRDTQIFTCQLCSVFLHFFLSSSSAALKLSTTGGGGGWTPHPHPPHADRPRTLHPAPRRRTSGRGRPGAASTAPEGARRFFWRHHFRWGVVASHLSARAPGPGAGQPPCPAHRNAQRHPPPLRPQVYASHFADVRPSITALFRFRNGYFYELAQESMSRGRGDPCPTHTLWVEEVGVPGVESRERAELPV